MRRLLWRGLLLLALCGPQWAVKAEAGLIYSTFGPGDSFNTANDSLNSWTVGGVGPYAGIQEEWAVAIDPTEHYTLDSIRVGAFHYLGGNEVDVYLTSGSAPGAPIESFSMAGIPGTATILTFNSVLHPDLLPGTRYWVVMSTSNLSGNDIEWSWNDQHVNGPQNYRQGGGGWISYGALLPALDVRGDVVPEPGSLTLVGAGLLGVAARRRRRASAQD